MEAQLVPGGCADVEPKRHVDRAGEIGIRTRAGRRREVRLSSWRNDNPGGINDSRIGTSTLPKLNSVGASIVRPEANSTERRSCEVKRRGHPGSPSTEVNGQVFLCLSGADEEPDADTSDAGEVGGGPWAGALRQVRIGSGRFNAIVIGDREDGRRHGATIRHGPRDLNRLGGLAFRVVENRQADGLGVALGRGVSRDRDENRSDGGVVNALSGRTTWTDRNGDNAGRS